MSSNVIKIQKIPKKEANIDDLLASFSLSFSTQYKYKCKQLPYKGWFKCLGLQKKEKLNDFCFIRHALTNAKPKDMKNLLTI